MTATALARLQQSTASAALGQVAFQNAPAAYVQGSGQSINVAVDQAVGSQHDLLVIAWSDEQQGVVDGFSHTLADEPWRITAGQLDKLPIGRNNVQVMLRDNGRVTHRADHWVQVEEPAAATGPTVSFRNAPASYEKGSGGNIDLALEGELPDGADMLVLAWSDAERAMVDAFAHRLTSDPWRITSARLDELPEGRTNIQVVLRLPDQSDVRADQWVEIEPATPDVDVPTPGFDSSTSDTYVIGSDASDPIKLTLSGPMPEGGDFMVLAWSEGEQRMVDEFAHRIAEEPWRITTGRLDELPEGRNSLQVLLRVPDHDTVRVTRWLNVTGAGDGDTDDGDTDDGSDGGTDDGADDGADDGNDDSDSDDGGSGGGGDDTGDDDDTDQPDDGNADGTPPDPNFVDRSSDGWTRFARASDARVIYVSSSRGSDNNDGLSEDRPVKTLNRGYNLLRNGYPDHMLLRRGDRFSDVFPGWAKSGRSKEQRMLIGTYGDGARPIVGHGGGNTNAFSHRPTLRHLAIVGITFDGRGRNNNIRLVGAFQDFLIEDCYIHSAKDNINAHQFNGGRPSGLQIRRSVIVDSRSSGSHSQGLYAGYVDGVLIEDNVWDHNGHGGGSQPTIFNHNMYIFQCHDVTIRNNIMSHGSSFGIKLSSNATRGSRRVLVEDNVLFGNANGLSIGYSGGNGYGSPYNFTDVTVRRNLFTSLGRAIRVGSNTLPQAYGIHATSIERGRIENNYFVHKSFEAGHGAIQFDSGRPNTDVRVQSNVVFDWYMPSGGRNTHIMLGNGVEGRWNEVHLASNRYEDASRNVVRYHGWIGREASQNAFASEARKQAREFWRPAYEAKSVMSYIREGYTLLTDFD